MTYTVQLEKKAKKQLAKMDKTTAHMIITWMRNNLEGCSDPRIHGKALVGNKTGYWRYRIGDYRLIADIQDDKLIILVVEAGHRREIYE